MAGSIQGNINQALGTLGVLAQLSPDLKQRAETKRELRSISKREANLEEQVNQSLKPALNGKGKYKEAESIVAKDNLKNLEDTRKRKYELDPSKENYDRYLSALRAKSVFGSLLDIKRENAMSKATSIAESKKEQRRNFMDYISKMPMLGETVGSIDARNPGFAKKIASQYSKSQRKALMDQMDKEAKNGKSN